MQRFEILFLGRLGSDDFYWDFIKHHLALCSCPRLLRFLFPVLESFPFPILPLSVLRAKHLGFWCSTWTFSWCMVKIQPLYIHMIQILTTLWSGREQCLNVPGQLLLVFPCKVQRWKYLGQKLAPSPVVNWVMTPISRVASPLKPAYFRPSIGVIHFTPFKIAFGAHLVGCKSKHGYPVGWAEEVSLVRSRRISEATEHQSSLRWWSMLLFWTFSTWKCQDPAGSNLFRNWL